MTTWVAVSFGALDVGAHPSWGDDYRYLIAPVQPGVPVMLWGDGARVWEQLVAGPVDERDLDADDRDVAAELEAMGIASRDPEHSARVREVRTPWLSSPIHELVYALLGRVADQSGVELVFIKGPTLHAQGLRTREHSGDVDCWVQPGSEERFARAMQPWGWQPAFSAFTGTSVLHSLTLRAPDWGCAVDVHSWFPGMTVSHDDAFAQLRRSAEDRVFAGYVARTPERAVHAVISALHDIRPSGGHAVGEDLVERAAETLAAGGEDAADVVVATGAEYALRKPMTHAFPTYRIDYSRAPVPVDWPWRMQPTMLRTYIAALRTLTPRNRLRTIYRIVWPTSESLLAGPIAQESAGASVRELRAKRAKRGISELVSAAGRLVRRREHSR